MSRRIVRSSIRLTVMMTLEWQWQITAAVKNGAGRVEGTINGIRERAGNAALEEIAVALNIRQDYYQVETSIVLNETINTSEMVSRFSGIPVPKNKAVVGGNTFSHESGIH